VESFAEPHLAPRRRPDELPFRRYDPGALAARVDDVRERVAKDALRGPTPLAEIAYRLGFSDLAAFSRTFRRWTGIPPGPYRRRI